MTRVVMIGIDGLDADLLRVYGPSLPNLRRLMLESPFLELKSSFPPETATAWASIYTGLNPAQHGIIDGRVLQERQETESLSCLLQGETFWDIAGRAGKRTCIVNPLFFCPAWKINGLMLSLPPLLPSPTIPSTRHLRNFCHALMKRTSRQAEIGLELLTREPWDVFFLQLNALDYVQHLLWRYSDPSDPTYPGRSEHAGRILDFYRLFDSILGLFRSSMERDCLLLVVSGYGHGRCCIQKFHLNEWLRSQGYLSARTKSLRLLDRRYLTERAKRRSMQLLSQFHLYDVLPHVPRSRPVRMSVGRAANLVEQSATLAQMVDLAGVSPFGGIRLNRAHLERKRMDYRQVRETLLQELQQVRLKGLPVVSWARCREDVYQGMYLDEYPDILFELRADYGVSADLYVPLTSTNQVHSVLSGDHRMQGVLLIGNMAEHLEIADNAGDPTVMDVAPTILRLLGVAVADRAGEALLLPFAAKQLI